jgi:hypothetical protein
MNNADPLMGSKLKSETNFQNMIFEYFEPCFARLASKFEKMCQNTQNFTLISNLLKKLLKNAPKKIIRKTSLTNMSKSEKVHISVTFLLITFIGCIFSRLFQRI